MYIKIKKLFLNIVLLGVSFFILVSCSESKSVKESEPIQIAFSSWPGFDIIYYAQTNGIFKKYNLNIELVRYPSQEDARNALENLEVDAVMTSIWDALNIKSSHEFEILLSTNVSYGADGIVAQKEIKTMKDLLGKKISAQLGSVNELILLEALELNNMSRTDVEILDITNEEALPKLFHDEIEAAVIWEPLLSTTKKKIDGNILFTTKDVDSLVIDLLIVNKQSRIQHADIWQKVLLSWFDIMKELQSNPKKVFNVISFKTVNPSFESDYSGLKSGGIELNEDMFLHGRLEKSMKKVCLYLSDSQANLQINSSFMRDTLEVWKEQQ